MYYVALRYLSNKSLAEDALAEAFNRVFKKLEKFCYEGDGSLGRWIKTIVINESLRQLTLKKRLVYMDDLSAFKPETNEQFDDNIDMEYLMSVIQEMPDGYRIVFNLYAIENYSHTEIAEILEISISTSKTQLYKARHYLMRKLEKHKEYELGRS